MNIKPCMGHISGTWELLLCEYWRKSMIIGEKNTDLKRLTGRLKLRLLTEIGQLHWNQGKEVTHFAWFGEPWVWWSGTKWTSSSFHRKLTWSHLSMMLMLNNNHSLTQIALWLSWVVNDIVHIVHVSNHIFYGL